MDEKELAELDTEKIMIKQVEELENEKRQLVTPLKAQEKEVDPLECAKSNVKRHIKWHKEQEEKRQRHRDEELKRQREEKECLEQERKEAEEEEYRKKKELLDAQSKRQQEREKEMEKRQRERDEELKRQSDGN